MAAKVITEDLGKIVERAICFLYDTPYVGAYKYSEAAAREIAGRITDLRTLFPACHHTAEKGSRYDFTAVSDTGMHLSSKSNKSGDKICPQVIGQPSLSRFCKHFALPAGTIRESVKSFIEGNLTALLVQYEEHTFDCPIIYYNQKTKKALYIRRTTPIVWDDQTLRFSHITAGKAWNESTTIYAGAVGRNSIGEFQVHTKRDCIKFRWNLLKLLELFAENFEVIPILR